MKKYIVAAAIALLTSSAAFAGKAESMKKKDKFAEADTNKDGRISPEEAKAKQPKWFAKFGLIDTNKDGFLSKQEVISYKKKKK